jgi:hypothetical protein
MGILIGGKVMKRRYRLVIALVITVPVALLFALSDAFTGATLQAQETAPSIGSSAVAQVGYGVRPVRVKAGNTVTRQGAGSGRVISNLSVHNPNVVQVAAETRGAVTLLRFTGVNPGLTTVSWDVNDIPHSLIVVVFDN